MIAWPGAIILFLIGCPTVIWLAVFFASFGNAVHRFSHTPKSKLNPFIKLVQKTGLFISFEHHNVHHFDEHGPIRKENTTGRYCPMTNWLNPLLDKSGFFRLLERIFN